MAQVNFAPDNEKPALDDLLEQFAAAATAEKPLRLRVQPDLYDVAKTRYTTWPGLVWTVDLEDANEGRRLREGLAQFFRLFGKDGDTQALLLDTLAGLEPPLV